MLTFKGSPGSPYTRKMLSLLRYRRIPYQLLGSGAADARDLPRPKVALLPTFYLPDENGTVQALTDSTPLLRQFESRYQGREVIPHNPALRFIDYLIEDYADEWLTKPMFHYRWHYDADADKATSILPYWHDFTADEKTIAERQRAFRERQRSRLYVVGSNEHTKSLIEDSYHRFLDLLQTHLCKHSFLMGERPGASDFAVFGQLTCLAHFDPTPTAITLSRAPRVYAWVSYVDDLSGLDCEDDQWIELKQMAETYRALLSEIGRSYVPVMLANTEAVDAGQKTFETNVDGTRWQQQTFPYQKKCLTWIREEYQRLSQRDRNTIDNMLDGTDCEGLVG